MPILSYTRFRSCGIRSEIIIVLILITNFDQKQPTPKLGKMTKLTQTHLNIFFQNYKKI